MSTSVFATRKVGEDFTSYKMNLTPQTAVWLLPELSELDADEYVNHVVVAKVAYPGNTMWNEMEIGHTHNGETFELYDIGILDIDRDQIVLFLDSIHKVEGAVNKGEVELIIMQNSNKKNTLRLSRSELETISQIAIDEATGNYLIRERTREYLNKFSEVMKILNGSPLNEKEQQIVEYFNACSDPDLYNKFIEKYS